MEVTTPVGEHVIFPDLLNGCLEAEFSRLIVVIATLYRRAVIVQVCDSGCCD
jgi:hypothetical protein